MAQSLRDVMTSNPCTIDANKSVAYAAKMMQEEDVGLAPIVEGDMLVGMLTDRDIAVRVAAQGRNPEQVNVLEVASKKIVTIDPQQDLDDALRIMAQHQVRRLPVVEEDGRLIGVVAQADIARAGDDATTGQLVQEISDSGGQMSSTEEQGYGVQPEFEAAVPEPEAGPEIQEEEEVSRVQAASARPRRRSTRKRTTTARKRSTSKRATSGRKKTTSRKKSTASRKRSTTKKRSTAKRGTAKRKTTSRKRSTAKRGTAKRKTTARKRSTAKRGTAKRKTTSRKRSTAKRGTAKRKTTSRKRSTAKRSTAKRSTAKRRTTRRRTSRK
jgi:CBS domain-containing protein